MATVQAVYRQAGRQTQGFLESVFQLMKISVSVPDHSTLSRRRGQLEIELPVRPTSAARHLVIDSTGVKVYGEGEWKVRQHGVSKRRTWRKLHVCVEVATWEIVAVGASTNDVSDGEMLLRRLDGWAAEEVGQVSADGAATRRSGRSAQAAFHRATERRFSSTGTAAKSDINGMKTCAGSVGWGAKSGRKRVVTTSGV